MIPNMNEEKGVRYGVIEANKISGDVLNEITTEGLNLNHLQFLINKLDEEGIKRPEFNYGSYDDYSKFHDDIWEIVCNHGIDESDDVIDWENYDDTDIVFKVDNVEGFYDDIYLIIKESDKIGKFNICSPCFPNACQVNEVEEENGYKGYTVPNDWWELNTD